MWDNRAPIQSRPARLLVGGAKKRHGVILLYPDELTIVAMSTDTWTYLLGPGVWVCLLLPTFHTIGWLAVFLGLLAGIGNGDQVNKLRAARKASAGGDGVTRVPLDLITGIRTGRSEVLGGRWGIPGIPALVVTTADGAAYEFRGKVDNWQAHLAGALAARGHDVRVRAGGITVRPA